MNREAALLTIGILLEARELIDVPEKWTQGEAARNSQGWPVSPASKAAACFCAVEHCRNSCRVPSRLFWLSLIDRLAPPKTEFTRFAVVITDPDGKERVLSYCRTTAEAKHLCGLVKRDEDVVRVIKMVEVE